MILGYWIDRKDMKKGDPQVPWNAPTHAPPGVIKQAYYDANPVIYM